MLTLNVLRGRKFAPGVSSIRVSASFARDSKTTGFAHGNGRDGFVWACVLQWKIDIDSFRKASAQGVGNCKVVVEGEQNEIHGWIIIDMRSAKMNAIRADYEGDWIGLSGPKAHPLHETPELFLHYTYQDEHQLSMDRKSHAPPSPSIAHTHSPSKSKLISSPSKEEAPLVKEIHRNPFGDVQPKQTQEEAGHETSPAMEKPQYIDHCSKNSNAADTASTLPLGEGPQRHFKMTVDFRSFKANSKLPLNLANVFVEASLPKELASLIGSANSNSSILKSHPPVHCVRGSEIILAGGYSVMQFYTGIVNLATVLAKEPRIVIDVWHREPMKSDTLLGVASIPLAPLLQETFIENSSPVYAMIVKPSKPGQQKTSFEKQVEIGSIRVAISIEDLGQPRQMQSTPCALDKKELGTSENETQLKNKQGGESSNGILDARHGHHFSIKKDGNEIAEDQGRHASMSQLSPPTTSHPAERNLANENHIDRNHPMEIHPSNPASSPEYTAAWELEVWKKNEEENFLEGLEQREKERMAVLDNEWRKHEKLREEEVGALRGECSSLEIRLKEMLESVEERERKLKAAEEGQSRRKTELEREYATRISEAEAAVRRLQVECEHQLTIERDRNAELGRLKQSAEERLSIAESRSISLEKNFAEYRHRQQNTPEAQLQWEIQTLKEKLQKAEQKNEKLAKSKSKYKMEVIRLAQEIAQQHRESQGGCGGYELKEYAPHVVLQNSDRVLLRTNALRAAAEENVARSQVQREQLCSLKNELENLRQASTCASPSPPPLSPDTQRPPHNQPKSSFFPTPNPNQPPVAMQQKNSDVSIHNPRGRNEHGVNLGLSLEENDQRPSNSHLNRETEESGEVHEKCDLDDRAESPAMNLDTPKVERLLKQRHELLELGVYGKEDDVIKALDARIESVLRGTGVSF
ncbi:hypothetical protein BSKO_09621 [Bryopsis sp. KO-2023]|nr:hypothetical protein BSKO_09621 [Bryopsis sp. KO-2023]